MNKMTVEELENKLQLSEVILIDVREPDEFANEHIPNAISIPMDVVDENIDIFPSDKKIVFQCKSGDRAKIVCSRCSDKSRECSFYILEGGIESWKNQGKKLISSNQKTFKLPLMRQVQICAGSLVLLGVILGFIVNTNWFYLSGFVGAGLIFAGISGFCGMAVLLSKMPWNK